MHKNAHQVIGSDQGRSRAGGAGHIGGHREVLSAIRAQLTTGQSFALCLVVATQGSTYRKSGAVAVVSADGSQTGVISGGCLEAGLVIGAQRAIRAHAAACVVFDTQGDDDAVFGSGSGCRGRISVLLIPVSAGDPSPLSEALIAADAARLPLQLALSIEGARLGTGWCWWGAEQRALGSPAPELQWLRDRAAGELQLATADGPATVAVLRVSPAPRVLLIGAGPEAPALIRIAREMGWYLTVIDHRPVAVAANACLADHALVARPMAGLAQLGEETFDACVIMTHAAASDLEALRSLASRTEPFVGLLGPPSRRDELLRQLDVDSRTALGNRLQAPVGLHLGGHGPEALALAIAAQLQQRMWTRQ